MARPRALLAGVILDSITATISRSKPAYEGSSPPFFSRAPTSECVRLMPRAMTTDPERIAPAIRGALMPKNIRIRPTPNKRPPITSTLFSSILINFKDSLRRLFCRLHASIGLEIHKESEIPGVFASRSSENNPFPFLTFSNFFHGPSDVFDKKCRCAPDSGQIVIV